MILDNPYVPYIFIGAVFICLFFVAAGVMQAGKNYKKRRETITRIKHSQDEWQKSAAEDDEGAVSFMGRIANVLSRSGSKISDETSSNYSHVRLKLLRAGITNPKIPSVFWGTKLWSPIMFVTGFILLRIFVFQLLSPQVTAGLVIAVGILGFYAPEVFLFLKANYRKNKINKGLPDALDLLVVCVEAGLGLDSAFKRVSDEMALTNPQLGGEFKLLNLELMAGKPRKSALRNLAMRANLDSLNSLITLMIQTDKFGTSVAKALKVFADSFRTKRFQIAEEKAAKLPVKMLFPLIFFIFPSFLVVLIGPSIIEIYEKFIIRG